MNSRRDMEGTAAGGGQAPIRVDLALIHYPVVNKNGETIGSAVTNLDLHDMARAAKTYGVDTLYVVTPYPDQRQLVREILAHWSVGHGARYNAKRGEALALIEVCGDLEELYGLVTGKWGSRPLVLSTSARPQKKIWPFALVRERIAAGDSFLLLFGTAWGLDPALAASADGFLPPIRGAGDYNHLSVRSAATVVLDRLLGENERNI